MRCRHVAITDMPLCRALTIFCLAALTGAAASAAESPLTKEQLKDVVRLDTLTIPTPGEFFVALDKNGQPNWTQMFQPLVTGATASREQMSLLLGVLVADGYIAVEAQDSQGVKNVGKDIINLAKKLNLSQSILGRGNSINDFAENNDWSALREELEATQNEVKTAMAEQKDQDFVTLVTLGAWVRGMDVASRYISKNYTPELAELLRQPAIAKFLLSELGNLPERMRTGTFGTRLDADLRSILTAIDTNPLEPVSQAAVDSVAATSSALVAMIAEEKKKP